MICDVMRIQNNVFDVNFIADDFNGYDYFSVHL